MPDNMSSVTQLVTNAPNQQQLPVQNNSLGMQTQPQLGAGIQQNLRPFMANMQPSTNPPAFMHPANNFLPLQNNQLVMPHMSLAGPTPQQGQFHVGFGPQNGVGNANCNTMFPVQDQIMMNAAQILSQPQGHILAQSILSMLQHNNLNTNIPNGQFCAPFPLQNMNQQLPMQVLNPSQVVPYGMPPASHPMCSFPNQAPQAMVPQNPFFSANPQLGFVPGNQVRPQFNQNEKNMFPPVNTNAFMLSPFASQQLEANNSAPLNSSTVQPPHTKNSQPSAFTKSQANPYNNVKANVPNSNWKGSPSTNFKNKPNRGVFQGGFQKSKFHDINKGKRKFGGPKEHKHKGQTRLNNDTAGNFGVNSKKQNQELKRSFLVTYTEQEIQQWREARKKNYPSKDNLQKKQSEHLKDSKVIDREVLQRELKEILAKQAELGVEVAEVPSYYLMDSKKQGLESEEKRKFTNKRKFQNKFDRRANRKDRHSKKQKFANKDFSKDPSLDKRKPTLLQKLLSADIKRDKSHLLQVFRFMVINSFFKDWPDKPLRYPSVLVKENGFEGVEEKYLHPGNDVPECSKETTVQKLADLKNDNNVDGSEDGGIEESDEEEGEIID